MVSVRQARAFELELIPMDSNLDVVAKPAILFQKRH